jgi:hypothetical protein
MGLHSLLIGISLLTLLTDYVRFEVLKVHVKHSLWGWNAMYKPSKKPAETGSKQSLVYTSTLKTEAIYSSKAMGFLQTTWLVLLYF